MAQLMLLLLPALTTATTVTSVSPSLVYMKVPTTLIVTGAGFTAGPSATCAIESLDDNFVDANYTDSGYNILRELPATVLNDTHLECRTVALDNAGPGTLVVNVQGRNGSDVATAPIVNFVPMVEWAIGRRPYVWEDEGELLVRTHPSIAGAQLRFTAVLHAHDVNGTGFDGRVDPRIANGGSLFGAAQTVSVVAAGSHRLEFSLTHLPAVVMDDLVVTVNYALSDGRQGTVRSWKRFHRVPPPPDNRTVFQVDHETSGMLKNGWEPFVALGWFNTAFEYAHESSGDMALVNSTISPWVARGGSLAVEWGKRGHTLMRVGNGRGPETILAILDEAEKAGVYVMLSPPASTYARAMDSTTLGWLKGNISYVAHHPALWGWYICDDCCSGFDYLWQLAMAYDVMKEVDPYHLTAGFLECAEMQAFQEPHLSLDAPIRENYRPDLAFHAGDGGAGRPGSDGALKMAPMTFEPVVNGPQVERQWTPEVARSNVYLGLINGNMANVHWYVYNGINYLRWQNRDLVDRTFAEVRELLPSFYAPFDVVHPTTRVLTDPSGSVRARAWREPSVGGEDGAVCVHVAVVNTVAENAMPQPGAFSLRIDGLSANEQSWLEARGHESFKAMALQAGGKGVEGAVDGIAARTLFDGCVVNAADTKHQTYLCRQVPLKLSNSGGGGGGLVLSDWIGATDAALYRIGCDREASNGMLPSDADAPDGNLVFDPSFERTMQPGVPGYNIQNNHQAFWILALPPDANALSGQPGAFDDRTWLHIDTMLPHSGRHSGRFWLPLPAPYAAYATLPCADKNKTVCGDFVSGQPGVSVTVELHARASVGVADDDTEVSLELVVGGWVAGKDAASPPSFVANATLASQTLTHEWQSIKGSFSNAAHDSEGRIMVKLSASRPASVWIDDVSVRVV